tara:strand:- start:289 stop:504 length:216 start_codon:yes stop_codon:yes gene_type:complete
MKIGSLYEVKHKWLLPHGSSFWKMCDSVIYLGEEGLINQDGQKIVNHVLLAKGEKKIVDSHFLKFLEPVSG